MKLFNSGKTQIDLDKENQGAENITRLSEIDKLTIRPLRAVLSSANPDQSDLDRLAALEEEAVNLRAGL